MAWNEPGGSPKNPWGKRPGKSGDDAFRKFQRKLDNIMKGGGPGNDDGGSGGTGGSGATGGTGGSGGTGGTGGSGGTGGNGGSGLPDPLPPATPTTYGLGFVVIAARR